MAYKRKTTRVTKATRRTDTVGGKTKTSTSTGYSTGAAGSTRITTSYDTKGKARTTITKRFGDGWIERRTLGSNKKYKSPKTPKLGSAESTGMFILVAIVFVVYLIVVYWKYIALFFMLSGLIYGLYKLNNR